MKAEAAGVVGFALLVGLAVGSLAQAEGTEIRLPNRVFDPAPGIEADLEASLRDVPAGGVQALLQFIRPLSVDDRERLERSHIELRQYVGANAYVARLTAPADLTRVPGFRWAGRLLPQDKIAAQLWNTVRPEVLPPSRTRKVVVHFEDGTSPEAAKAVIERFSRLAQPYGPMGVFAFEIEPGELEGLAREPSVRWIEGISDDRLPLAAP